MTPRAILTDIEGTTSSIAFVHDVLFPFSRSRLADYVTEHAGALTAILDAVRAEVGDPLLDTGGCIAWLEQWHDADRKIGPLKVLQGLIWHQGYASGAIKGHVYLDAVAGLRRWHQRGITLAVYSSGSVAAQKLLFGHSDFGDLTALFTAHFDTQVGAKQEADAYRRIAAALGYAPGDILFLSDVEAELAAAHAVGFGVTLLARNGLPSATPYPVVANFDTLLP